LPGTTAAAGQELQRAEAERALWWAIGCAEMSSEHPLAKVLTEAAAAAVRVPLTKPAVFESVTGVGVRSVILGCEVRIASAHAVVADTASAVGKWVESARADGSTVVVVVVDGVPLAGLALQDTLVPHARRCVAELEMAGAEVWMCTGDHLKAAQKVALECGIRPECIVAESLPGDKVATIRHLQMVEQEAAPSIVAMVGDGVNDAPALAAADLGVAIGVGHNVTVDAADVVVVGSDLHAMVAFFSLARKTLQTIWMNFVWALVFNTCALPVAAGALWHFRVLMNPQIAVCLMLSSSLFVVMNSLRLRRFTPETSTNV